MTYEFSVRVTRQTAFITNEDTRVVIPNLVAFNRTNDKNMKEVLEYSTAEDRKFNLREWSWKAIRTRRLTGKE